jgi:hypothetical protein
MTEPKQKKPHAPPPLHPHPLFEAEEPGGEAPIVMAIHVTRWDRDGKQRFFPTKFAADTLTDLSQVADNFGGGAYELIAYGPGGCTARRRYTLDGRPKPLWIGEEDSAPAPTAAAPFAAAPAPTGQSIDSNLLLAMLNMQAEGTKAMLGMVTQLTTAMLSRDRDSADRTLAMMQQNNTAQMQSMASLVTAVMTGGGKGNDGKGVLEMIREGMAIGQQMAGPQEDSDLDRLAEMAAPFVAGMAQSQAPAPHQDPGGES